MKVKLKWEIASFDDCTIYYECKLPYPCSIVIYKNAEDKTWEIDIDRQYQILLMHLKNDHGYVNHEEAKLAIEIAITEWLNEFIEEVTYE